MSEWRPMIGYSGTYEVSDEGQLRALPRFVPGGRPKADGTMSPIFKPGRVLKPQIDPQGYTTHQLNIAGKYKFVFAHRVVAEAFLGPCPAGHEVNHKNGNKSDNRVANLEYVTPSQNMHHRYDVLKLRRGDDNPLRKLCEAQIPAIRAMLRDGMGQTAIARKFGVTPSCIDGVKKGRSWRHVPDA